MTSEQINVPFTLPEMFAGFVAGNGLAKATPSELTLEFVVQDNVLNVFKTGVKEIHIPRGEIDWIQHKRGWFGDPCAGLNNARILTEAGASSSGTPTSWLSKSRQNGGRPTKAGFIPPDE